MDAKIIIQMKWRLTRKLTKKMNRKIMLMKISRFYSETFSSLSFQTWPWQCHIIIPTACLRMCSGIKYEDENSNAEISHVLSPQVTRPIRTRKLFKWFENYSTLSEVAPQPAGRGPGLLRREGEARGEEGGHQEDPLQLRVQSPSSSQQRHCGIPW